MNTSLPPFPADLWPKVIAVAGTRPPGRMLTLEIPGLSESPFLNALSRSIHLEMRAAGEWAARIGSASDKDFPSSQAFSRHRAEEAARLLAIYTALHASAQYITSFNPTPEVLKASASRSYQLGLRDERETQQQDQPSSRPAFLSTPTNTAQKPEPNHFPDSPSPTTPRLTYEPHPKIKPSH
jgi:hypothetical protein